MTQPQDKMRAEFEAWCEIMGMDFPRYKSGIYKDDGTASAWEAWKYKSAQSQQDTLDASRYRWLREHSSTRDGMTDCQAVARMVGFTQFPTLTMESRLHDPDSAIDALIATQGASNV